MKRTYPYGSQIGYLPTPDEFPPGAVGFDGWYYTTSDETETKVDEAFEVKEAVTLEARWEYDSNN